MLGVKSERAQLGVQNGAEADGADEAMGPRVSAEAPAW